MPLPSSLTAGTADANVASSSTVHGRDDKTTTRSMPSPAMAVQRRMNEESGAAAQSAVFDWHAGAVVSAEITLRDRLERERIAWLCTLRSDGSPHLTPVWFVHRADCFWISSGERNRKVRNIMNDPRVSLALEGADAPHVAEGRARLHSEVLAEDVLVALAAKYDGWDAAAEVKPFGSRVLLEIQVDRWLLNGVAQ